MRVSFKKVKLTERDRNRIALMERLDRLIKAMVDFGMMEEAYRLRVDSDHYLRR